MRKKHYYSRIIDFEYWRIILIWGKGVREELIVIFWYSLIGIRLFAKIIDNRLLRLFSNNFTYYSPLVSMDRIWIEKASVIHKKSDLENVLLFALNQFRLVVNNRYFGEGGRGGIIRYILKIDYSLIIEIRSFASSPNSIIGDYSGIVILFSIFSINRE